MVLEHLGDGGVRVSLYDRKCAHVVADVGDTFVGNLFGFAEGAADENYGAVFFGPGFSGQHALVFLGAAIGFRKRHPGRHARTVLVAKISREKCVVGAHVCPSFLCGVD